MLEAFLCRCVVIGFRISFFSYYAPPTPTLSFSLLFSLLFCIYQPVSMVLYLLSLFMSQIIYRFFFRPSIFLSIPMYLSSSLSPSLFLRVRPSFALPLFLCLLGYLPHVISTMFFIPRFIQILTYSFIYQSLYLSTQLYNITSFFLTVTLSISKHSPSIFFSLFKYSPILLSINLYIYLPSCIILHLSFSLSPSLILNILPLFSLVYSNTHLFFYLSIFISIYLAV